MSIKWEQRNKFSLLELLLKDSHIVQCSTLGFVKNNFISFALNFFNLIHIGLIINLGGLIGFWSQFHHFNQAQVGSLLEVFLGLCIMPSASPHKDDREVSPCPRDQLRQVRSSCHSYHSLGLPAVEVECIVAVPGSSCLLPLLLHHLLY